jgi:Tfp pilus assembly protein PilO
MIKLQALHTIFTRLSKKEQFILYIAAFFIALTLLDRLIIEPIFSKMQSLDKEIQEKEAAIRRNTHIVVQKDRILAEVAKYTSFLSTAKSEDEEITSFLKEIENLADKSSVYLVDMKPAGVKDLSSSKKYLLNLNCEAQMEQLADFMYNIENSNKLLTIDKYQISPKSKESSIAKCSISISKMVIP